MERRAPTFYLTDMEPTRLESRHGLPLTVRTWSLSGVRSGSTGRVDQRALATRTGPRRPLERIGQGLTGLELDEPFTDLGLTHQGLKQGAGTDSTDSDRV